MQTKQDVEDLLGDLQDGMQTAISADARFFMIFENLVESTLVFRKFRFQLVLYLNQLFAAAEAKQLQLKVDTSVLDDSYAFCPSFYSLTLQFYSAFSYPTLTKSTAIKKKRKLRALWKIFPRCQRLLLSFALLPTCNQFRIGDSPRSRVSNRTIR
jgi:hypothetical protein